MGQLPKSLSAIPFSTYTGLLNAFYSEGSIIHSYLAYNVLKVSFVGLQNQKLLAHWTLSTFFFFLIPGAIYIPAHFFLGKILKHLPLYKMNSAVSPSFLPLEIKFSSASAFCIFTPFSICRVAHCSQNKKSRCWWFSFCYFQVVCNVPMWIV